MTLCHHLTPVSVDHCQHCGHLHGATNPGVEAARLAAHAAGGTWLAPVFRAERPVDRKGATDFNDLHLAEGLHVVRDQVEAHLRMHGLLDSAPPTLAAKGAGPAGEGGGGELLRQIGIDQALERYSLVYGGKGTLFDHEEHCLVPKSDVLDICPDHAWRDLKRLGGLPLVRPAEIGFDPGGTDGEITCNLWGGWPTTPRAGRCELLLALLEHLCSHENNARDVFHWVLKWLAYPIQNPGAKMRTALVMHGGQGAGKNLFFEAVMAIYGAYGRIIDQASLEDKFNDWASRKLFLIADEVVSRAELFHTKNKLKQFITGEWIRINPKNVMAHDERNHVNVVFLSNDKQPLVLEKDDRRYTVIWTPEKLGRAQYQDVRDEIRAGGIAALHQFLLDLELGDFDAYAEAPMTQAKRDLIALGLESTERFLEDWAAGDIPGRVEEHEALAMPFCPCASSDLYATYRRWCVLEGVTRPREQSAFLGHIAKLPGWSKTHKDIYGSLHYAGATKRQRMVVPSAAALGEALKRPGATDHRQPDGQTQAQWLTDCFFAFRNAMPRSQ